jgi:predicted MFS family arabinose efflux permease
MFAGMPGTTGRASSRVAALAEVFREPALRRVELAWAGYYVAEWTGFVALSVYAYGFGGATAVGVLGLVRAVPAALGVPAGSAVADRAHRERVLFGIQVLRGITLAASAALVNSGEAHWLVFLLAALTAGVGGAYRPAQLALVPLLARTPQELVATNVSSSMLEGLAVLVGPLLAGVLLAFGGAGSALLVAAAISAWAAVLVARVSPIGYVPARGQGAFADLVAGVRTLAKERNPRLVIFLFASQSFVRGLLNVLLVVIAFQLLDLGDSGVGFLNAAFGAGGLLGGMVGLGLVGIRRLARPFAAGLVMLGAPIALVAAWPHAAWTAVCLAVVGAGNAILDVSGFTLIQRGIDDDVLARVFGVFEILVITALGAGSILGPLFVSLFGPRGALAVAGAILPILALLTFGRLGRVDAAAVVPERQLGLLRSIPLFSPLPATTLDRLAGQLSPLRVAAESDVVRRGDTGDLFYVIAKGHVEVSENGRPIAQLGSGDYFGEIALLNNVPRVATCTATTDTDLYTLERERFLSAVTGNRASAEEIKAVVDTRLTQVRAAS